MSVRKGIIDRMEQDDDATAIALRNEIGAQSADYVHAEQTNRDYMVVDVGRRAPSQLDKSGAGDEVSQVTVKVVTDSVARAEALVELVRKCYESVTRPGDNCTLAIDDRCFVHMEWLGDEVTVDPAVPDIVVGHVDYEVTAYREDTYFACSFSSSSTSSSSSS